MRLFLFFLIFFALKDPISENKQQFQKDKKKERDGGREDVGREKIMEEKNMYQFLLLFLVLCTIVIICM